VKVNDITKLESSVHAGEEDIPHEMRLLGELQWV
jgi:hypothetical protein